MNKPVLLITRRVPPAITVRASRDYDARLNPQDTPHSGAELLGLAEGAAAVLCCPGDRLDAAMIKADPNVAPILEKIKAHQPHGGPGGGSLHAFHRLARGEMPAITSTTGFSAVPALAAW